MAMPLHALCGSARNQKYLAESAEAAGKLQRTAVRLDFIGFFAASRLCEKNKNSLSQRRKELRTLSDHKFICNVAAV
jgi:hypothetical protein